MDIHSMVEALKGRQTARPCGKCGGPLMNNVYCQGCLHASGQCECPRQTRLDAFASES